MFEVDCQQRVHGLFLVVFPLKLSFYHDLELRLSQRHLSKHFSDMKTAFVDILFDIYHFWQAIQISCINLRVKVVFFKIPQEMILIQILIFSAAQNDLIHGFAHKAQPK